MQKKKKKSPVIILNTNTNVPQDIIDKLNCDDN